MWASPDHIGGIEKYSHDLALALIRHGVDTTLIAPVLREDQLDFKHISVKPFGNFWRNRIEFMCSYHMMYKRLYKILEKNVHKFHILNAHNPYSAGLATSNIAKRYKVPSVLTLHLNIAWDHITKQHLTFHFRLAKKNIMNYSKIIVNTQTLKNALVEKFDISADIIEVISPFVDTKKFSRNGEACGEIRKKYCIPDNAVILLCVARLVPPKNIKVLLSALNILSNPKIFCFIVGEGPQEAELKKYCVNSHLCLNERIFFLKNLSTSELPAYYQVCDIFVLPSVSEGFGLVFLEAWASSKPVIGADIPVIKNDVIKEEYNGLLFKGGSENSLAQAIDRLSHDNTLRIQLGRNGKELVERKYTEQVFVESYISIFKKLM